MARSPTCSRLGGQPLLCEGPPTGLRDPPSSAPGRSRRFWTRRSWPSFNRAPSKPARSGEGRCRTLGVWPTCAAGRRLAFEIALPRTAAWARSCARSAWRAPYLARDRRIPGRPRGKPSSRSPARADRHLGAKAAISGTHRHRHPRSSQARPATARLNKTGKSQTSQQLGRSVLLAEHVMAGTGAARCHSTNSTISRSTETVDYYWRSKPVLTEQRLSLRWIELAIAIVIAEGLWSAAVRSLEIGPLALRALQLAQETRQLCFPPPRRISHAWRSASVGCGGNSEWQAARRSDFHEYGGGAPPVRAVGVGANPTSVEQAAL